MESSHFDLIIVGGSMAGCFAAIDAASKGASVLLIEARTYFGREITATLRPWISSNGMNGADELIREITGVSLHNEPKVDPAKTEIPLSIGHLKKKLLEKLRNSGVQVLFMSETAGVLVENELVRGIVVGNKSGLQAFTAKAVIDTTENHIVTQLAGGNAVVAGGKHLVRRSIEFVSVAADVPDTIDLPDSFQLWRNRLSIHKAVPGEGRILAEFSFEVDVVQGNHAEKMNWEIDARRKTIGICQFLRENVPSFLSAVLIQTSPELWHLPLIQGNPHGVSNLLALNTDGLWFEHQDFRTLALMQNLAKYTVEYAMEQAADSRWEWDRVQVRMRDSVTPLSALNPLPRQDGSLGISYYSLDLPSVEQLPSAGECDILVAGGGTAGAPAAIGALGSGFSVMVVEGNSGLGGTGTLGGINTYWFGYNGGFSMELDAKVAEMTRRISNHPQVKPWNIEAKMMTYLDEITKRQGTVLFRTSVVNVLRDDRTIQALVVLGPDGLSIIRPRLVIDATGDGDVAALAGIPYVIGEARGGNVQTFNVCEWKITGFLSGVNLDAGVMDDTNVFDATRGVIVGHGGNSEADFSPYPAARESRHIQGAYTLAVKDILSQVKFSDTIAIGSTDYDQHGLQSSDFARLGYLPYHKGVKEARIPFRVCYTKEIDNLLVTGKAFSAERDAFSFMRMQRDMQNMGFAIGCAAAQTLLEDVPVGAIDIAKLQRKLLDCGILREEDLPSPGQRQEKTESIIRSAGEADGFLQLICMPKDTAVPLLKQCCGSSEYEEIRQPIAMALAWFGESDGVDELITGLKLLMDEEQNETIDHQQRPVGGFVGQADTYWRANQLITLLGMSGDKKALDILCEIVNKTDSGGEPYKHARLHWRRIPNYDRIICLCHSIERLADPVAASALEELIQKPHLSGYVAKDALDGDGGFAGAYLEVVIARTMAACGSRRGFLILVEALKDKQAVLSGHAHTELQRLTGEKIELNYGLWLHWLENRHKRTFAAN